MVRAGIIGLGWWGKNIVNAVQGKTERLHFIRGVSKEPDGVRDFAAKHEFELSTELDDVVRDPRVQAVVLATPHSLHVDQIVAVTRAGKPVFCEKPLALRRAEAVRAVEACRKAGVILGIGTNKRFWPAMPALKKVMESGVLGEILHIESHYSNENSGANFAPWRDLASESPGGGMTGAGIHALDALVYLMGPLKRVHGQLIVRKPRPDPSDTVSVVIEFQNGVSGFLGTVRASPFYWRVHVFGRNGSAEAIGENELVVRLPGGRIERSSFEKVDTLRAEFEAFADAVEGRAPDPIPPEQMIDVVAAFEAIIEALERNATVAVAAR
jgi:predicted dehydrogenase